MNGSSTGGPTILRPEAAHHASASIVSSQGLPRDLLRQATVRLRVMALLYAVVFFLAGFFPALISADGRAMMFSTVVHWLPGTLAIAVALVAAGLASPDLSPRAVGTMS